MIFYFASGLANVVIVENMLSTLRYSNIEFMRENVGVIVYTILFYGYFKSYILYMYSIYPTSDT